ncbi:hypothetical protein BA059_02630 [Mycolicibacterium sp. (ex Dasyatis americana)]|nr:hypothetical protein BA059_02630 [Mycolicibacterium sp. (ex Dasyatis americana)]
MNFVPIIPITTIQRLVEDIGQHCTHVCFVACVIEVIVWNVIDDALDEVGCKLLVEEAFFDKFCL